MTKQIAGDPAEAMASVAPGRKEVASASDIILSIEGAGRRFGDQQVLEDINLEAEAGQIFGLVGPSGCGKTTLVKLIVGLLEPSEGTVLVDGVEPADFGVAEKRRIGYVPQEFSLYPTLTVWENTRFMASLYGLGWLKRRRRIRNILSFLEIWDARKRLAQDLSGGMKRRLSLAGALLHEPEVLVVDEPTAGLDPALRVRIWEMLREIRDHGTTIFLTTQYIEEAERCDRVAVLNNGRLVAAGAPADLRRRADIPDIIEVEAGGLTYESVQGLWSIPGVRGVEWDRGANLTVHADESASVQAQVESALDSNGHQVSRVRSRSASFEEVFMRFTGHA